VQQTLSDGNGVTSSFGRPSNQIMVLLQQVLTNQNLILDQRKQLKQEMAAQQIAINNLSQAIEAIGKTKMLNEVMLSHESQLTTIPVLQPPSHLDKINVPDLKEETVKQLQFQQIDMSDKNGDFNYEFDHNTKASSSKLTTLFSICSTKLCISQLILGGIILIRFIFISMAFSNFGVYRTVYGTTNTSSLLGNLAFHGINDLDWFRALAVP
jgi:hypothetical protein